MEFKKFNRSTVSSGSKGNQVATVRISAGNGSFSFSREAVNLMKVTKESKIEYLFDEDESNWYIHVLPEKSETEGFNLRADKSKEDFLISQSTPTARQILASVHKDLANATFRIGAEQTIDDMRLFLLITASVSNPKYYAVDED